MKSPVHIVIAGLVEICVRAGLRSAAPALANSRPYLGLDNGPNNLRLPMWLDHGMAGPADGSAARGCGNIPPFPNHNFSTSSGCAGHCRPGLEIPILEHVTFLASLELTVTTGRPDPQVPILELVCSPQVSMSGRARTVGPMLL